MGYKRSRSLVDAPNFRNAVAQYLQRMVWRSRGKKVRQRDMRRRATFLINAVLRRLDDAVFEDNRRSLSPYKQQSPHYRVSNL